MQSNSPIDKPLSATASGVATTADSSRLRVFLAFVGALLLAYSLPLVDLVTYAAERRVYNFVLLIPFISLYLIWEKRHELQGPWTTSLLPSLSFVAIGAISTAFIYLGRPRELSDHYSLVALSVISFLWAGAFVCFGWPTLRKVAFPIFFLAFAIPMPSGLMHQIEVLLQHASAEAAYWLMNLTPIPFLRDGVDFKLPGIPIRVAEECSGFNSSYILFIVSFLGGYLFLRSPWRRAALTFAVIPLAILRNGFRITTIAWLCTYHGPEMIDHPIHHRGGPIFFALSLIPFLALVWWLRRSERKTKSQS